ncbi:hypothetical protein Tco_0472835 [Tanacetum coccineum]
MCDLTSYRVRCRAGRDVGMEPRRVQRASGKTFSGILDRLRGAWSCSASSAVSESSRFLCSDKRVRITYTSISSDSNRPSWGIPLVNADKLPEMDPYEEVAQQGQVPPLLPAYVPDPIELEEHVPVYVPEPEHPEYHVPSDDAIQDPKEDLSEEHEPEDDDEDLEEDPNEEHVLEDEDTKEEEPSEGSDETEPFEEDETAVTPPPPRHRGARIYVRPQTPMAASTQALIDAFVVGSPPFLLPPTSPTYDQALLAHRATMICMRDVMSARPKTHDDAIELANDLMDQKLCTYAERQNDNKIRLMIHQETINNPTRSKM